jgi:hypothetical protein
MIDSDVLEKHQIKPRALKTRRQLASDDLSLPEPAKPSNAFLPVIPLHTTKTFATFQKEYGTKKLQSNIFPIMHKFLSEESKPSYDEKRSLFFFNIIQTTDHHHQHHQDTPRYLIERTNSLPESLKIYNNSLAERLTKFHRADSMTIGKNIFFAPGRLDLSSVRGQALFAHEITHMMQQEKNPELVKRETNISSSQYSQLEREAQNVERNLLRFSSLQEYKKSPRFEHGGSSVREHSSTIQSSHPLPEDLYLVQSNISQIVRNMLKTNLSEFMNTLSENMQLDLQGRSRRRSSSTLVSTPTFLAEEGRSVNPPAIISSSETPIPPSAGDLLSVTPSEQSVDIIGRLADRVYDMIATRLKMERDRRGA